MTATSITLDGIVKHYGDTPVIHGLSAAIEAGEFVVILGPSGCGKSTMLNMLAGLEEVTSGTIRFGAREVQALEPRQRGCAMVFQNYALYPHMTVAENIGYALKVARVPKAERMARVAEAARIVELGDYLDRRPGALSGGQRQRVAIARAIVRAPEVMLFDEPLSNLDARLRHGMRMELRQLHRRIGATSIFVTHDQVEAMTLADRVMILNAGRIEQFDTPQNIYHRPASRFVASFIGAPAMNLIEVTGDGAALRLSDGTPLAARSHKGRVLLGIRPEKIEIGRGPLDLAVLDHEDLGSHGAMVLALPDGGRLSVATPLGTEITRAPRLRLGLPADHLHLFDIDTGLRLD
ncbi:sn-glycerol-3-phosphate ABC transporter ATP-binding protein UgpC (plasmid) [Thioclava sp. 'Guangxiensis']|uniref:ABC transporter ATP-binding protein n=1 Tax=Thioclava sp. 'Guangxiensis' TaxID=3149044 RepID=UPI0032C46182